MQGEGIALGRANEETPIDRVWVRSIGNHWLVDDELQICVVQSPAPVPDAIRNDDARPTMVSIVRDLLAENGGLGKLAELVPGGRPALVLLPEYAFGSSDWGQVDELVRTHCSPVIFIAGFGATLGAALRDWQTVGEAPANETRKVFGWPASYSLSNSMRYNGGWCWVHTDGLTECVAFLKNYPDQRVEPALVPDLELGRFIVALEAKDLTLFLGICADLICERADGMDPISRIKLWVQSAQRPARKSLIIGLLYQIECQHELWQNAIARAVKAEGTDEGLLVLANHATKQFAADEGTDRWRNLSGVYEGDRRQDKFADLPLARKLHDREFTGILVRSTEACAVAGPIRWSQGPHEGRYLWWPKQGCGISDDGVIGPPDKGNHALAELCRLVKRHLPKLAEHRHHGLRLDPVLEQGLLEIVGHLESGALPSAERLWSSILNGLNRAPKSTTALTPDQLHTAEEPLTLGLYGIALLIRALGLEWQRGEHESGQLIHSEPGIHVLLWRDPRLYGQEIRREMEAWVNEPGIHPPLLIFAEGVGGTIAEGLIRPDRRTDVTESPSERDITSARRSRRAKCVPFGILADCYMVTETARATASITERWPDLMQFEPEEEVLQ